MHGDKPRIIRLGPSKKDLEPDKWLPGVNGGPSEWEDLVFDPGNCRISPNQNVEISFNASGLLIVEAKQDYSTPGFKMEQDLILDPGEYDIVITGEASAEKTFFPWVIDSQSKLRLTPTTHLGTTLDSVSVPFVIRERTSIQLGVLCHNQRIGDFCAIARVMIRMQEPAHIESRRNYSWLELDSFVSHQSSSLGVSNSSISVRSKPLSTPGAYSRLEVSPNTKISIRARIKMASNCTAFLYVADDMTNEEMTRRTTIFESRAGDEGFIDEKFTYIDIPENVEKLKLGVLFSTVSTAETYEMEIFGIEVVEVIPLNSLVDKAFVLNLNGEEDKFRVCKRESRRHGLQLERWIAANGYSEENLSNWKKYMEAPWTDFDHKIGRKAINKPGAWGYLLSMKDIFENSIHERHECIAIFDDDFILSQTFSHDFSRLIQQIGDDWDVLYLGASQWAWDGAEIQQQRGYYKPTENTNGTFAVIYKKAVFEDILIEIEKMDSPFDSGPLNTLVTGKYASTSFVSFPNIAIANVEKEGIRDSRNQIEYARRFRWDLDDFPPWFTNWNIEPTVEREEWSFGFGPDEVDYFVGVTTLNRIEYLTNFVKSFEETLDEAHNWALIVADDGSKDGSLEWLLHELEPLNYGLVVIRNDSLGIARQSNSIFSKMMDMGPKEGCVLFMCNDDIRFSKPGWAQIYSEAIIEHNFDHLVYFNPEWKDPMFHELKPGRNPLESLADSRYVMGCFYTVTRNLIEKIGYFDEEEFPVRGHSHIDYTIRACRAGENLENSTFDVVGSNEFIAMEQRENYKRTDRTLGIWEYEQLHSMKIRASRERSLGDSTRLHVSRGW